MPGDRRTEQSVVRWEAPNTIFIAFVGRIDGEEMRAVNAAVIACARGKPPVFILVDLSHTESMTAEARSLATEPSKVIPARGAALFGASYPIRVISSLLSRVARLVSKQRKYPTCFFATEAEARTWIAEIRAAVSPQVPNEE